ncbi:T9SS type A sorting domain-containing protein [Hymenobacter negativus]|uniref:T9SS type A sorting domain-containing protein n=1 Tax=Hymenobacter negativus TaxID=2795026 RepID=A0ABS3QLG2_9BACT|nr:T9SS type A sorting domain-containing protein [Hymenobacter negativus]MBO2012104.1 T9SS type A sorting domain-containing protein [Hymenobacter negativus]
MKNKTSASPRRWYHPTGGLLVCALLLLGAPGVWGQRLPSFPGAEGAGKYVTGGRGTPAVPTTVFEVTSLADTNMPGTLRYALTATAAARTIVFRVCGTIHLTSRLGITRPNTTIAGQTAPGDGICLADYPVAIGTDNVVVRFLRFRMGDKNQQVLDASGNPILGSGGDDAFGSINHSNIIIDHCTMSWSDDEAFTFYGATTDSMTLQWNLISEPLNYSYHVEVAGGGYVNHGYGGIWGGRYASFHHNLFAHCYSRTPRWNGARYGVPIGSENCDFRNNVVYNWGINNTYGGEGGNYNMVNNYYKWGPNSSSRTRIFNPDNQTTAPAIPFPRVYLTGNYLDGSAAITAHNWKGVVMGSGIAADTVLSKVNTPFSFLPITTQTAPAAYNSVLQYVGCVLPARDALDQRIINDVQNRTGSIIDVQGSFPHGTPYSTSQAAWPVLACGPAPVDSDHDGMTDAYETAHGLNPNSPTDRYAIGPGGYTNLENYLNGLAAAVVLGSKSAADAAALSVYPNPAQGQFTLAHPSAGRAATIEIYSFDGRRVGTATVQPGTTQTQLPLTGLAAGCYLVRYQDAAGTLTVKLLHD